MPSIAIIENKSSNNAELSSILNEPPMVAATNPSKTANIDIPASIVASPEPIPLRTETN